MKNLKNRARRTTTTIARSVTSWTMLFALVLAAGVLTIRPVAAQAASCSAGAQPVTLVATINGGGRAVMREIVGVDGAGMPTEFSMGIKLYSDCTATGEFLCLDQPPSPGMIWGKVTRWSTDGAGNIVVTVVGKFVGVGHWYPPPGGHPAPVEFTVTIPHDGGGVGSNWTLAFDGFTVCDEILTSGRIIVRYIH